MLFLLLAALTGGWEIFPGPAAAAKIDINVLYPNINEPMLRKKCMECHPDIARLLRTAGEKHSGVACRDCHLQVHVYFSDKIQYQDILPKCARCHQHPHGEELVNCSDCHQEAHSPLYIPAGRALGQGCYVCHEDLDKDIKTFATQHTELYCTACHHTKHGHVPQCLECHQKHKGSLPAPGVIKTDLALFDQCLNCHPPHKALKVEYADDTPNSICGYCHRKAGEMLAANKTKHSALQCTLCHPAKHRTIKRCRECHGIPHPQSMVKKFRSCGHCHGVAHSVMR
jgi:predicted CXXCH cytochrome family protein